MPKLCGVPRPKTNPGILILRGVTPRMPDVGLSLRIEIPWERASLFSETSEKVRTQGALNRMTPTRNMMAGGCRCSCTV